MPKIKKKRIWWDDVIGPDVVGYHVYVAPQGIEFDYAMPHTEVAAGDTEIIAPDGFPEGMFDLDVNYSVWITTVDDMGNESDPLLLTAPFDFVAPPAPSAGGVEDWAG